mmetsp:Transcript_18667/g.26332  ORF Transcript_18667/g.26332 Transcript_18667/m.26332 type:complete len:382 (+) Transcript_18667:131-1276(+)
MSSNKTDAADEAGGEAIFSSDGLDTVPVPTKPVFTSQPQRDDGDEDVLDSGDVVAPTEAFELFSGKLYKTSTAMTIKASSNTTETPLEKLSRLQRDVAELERDLQGESTLSTKGPEHEELTKLASSLSARLQAASSYSHTAQQDKLTSLLQSHFQNATKASTSAVATATPATDGPAPVIYELYSSSDGGGDGSASAARGGSTSTSRSVPTSNLEERLLNLERSIGSSTTINKSVMERLAEFEKVISGVDKKSLEQTTARAKVIRADMEAASKARTKLDLSSNSTEAKKINELYVLMEQLESVQSHLPALVQRLQQLSVLHNQTATFSSRLTAAEQSLAVSSQKLGSVQETLSKLETGMVTNVKVIEENMNVLDERMKKLSS